MAAGRNAPAAFGGARAKPVGQDDERRSVAQPLRARRGRRPRPRRCFGGWTSCTDRVNDRSPTTTALVLAPPTASVVATARAAPRCSRRRDARCKRVAKAATRAIRLRSCRTTCCASSRGTCSIRRPDPTVGGARAARDLPHRPHNCRRPRRLGPRRPRHRRRLHLRSHAARARDRGGRRLMRAGLFAPAVFRELPRRATQTRRRTAARRPSRARTRALPAARALAHALPPERKPPRPLASARQSRSRSRSASRRRR